MVIGAFVVGVLAAAALWWLMKATFDLPIFQRANFRDQPVATAAGVLLPIAALILEAALTVADALGADVDAATIGPRRLVVLATVGFGLLGLLDDLAGAGESGGYAGHLRALARGRLTTGGVKLLGGAALAIVVVAAGTEHRSLPRLIADAALVALAANLGNLLDRAPGRVTKSGLAAFVVLAIATGAGPELVGVAAVVGAAAGLLIPDLREQLMLGDAGANVIGAVLGVGIVLACSTGVRLMALIAVAVLNLASEMVSFSRVIERVPPLRALDRLGRRS